MKIEKDQIKENLAGHYIDFEIEIENLLNNLSPEQIWLAGYKTSVNEPIFKRREFNRDLIQSLEQNGVNIFKIFILLGIDVVDIGELSPSNFGMLLRYFRVNDKSVLSVVACVLLHYPKLISSIITYSAQGF